MMLQESVKYEGVRAYKIFAIIFSKLKILGRENEVSEHKRVNQGVRTIHAIKYLSTFNHDVQ